jgi:hypothetical protein
MSRSTDEIRIEPSAVYRLAGGCHRVRVVDGTAWITAEAEDIIAGPNRELMIDGSETPILISGLYGRSVTLDISQVQMLAA